VSVGGRWILSSLRWFVRWFVRWLVRWFVRCVVDRSLVRLLCGWLVRLLCGWFVRSVVGSLVRSLFLSLVGSCACWFERWFVGSLVRWCVGAYVGSCARTFVPWIVPRIVQSFVLVSGLLVGCWLHSFSLLATLRCIVCQYNGMPTDTNVVVSTTALGSQRVLRKYEVASSSSSVSRFVSFVRRLQVYFLCHSFTSASRLCISVRCPWETVQCNCEPRESVWLHH